MNGWGIGEKHFGGFAEYARVDGKWLIHLPNKFTLEQSMIIESRLHSLAMCSRIKKRFPHLKEVIVTELQVGLDQLR